MAGPRKDAQQRNERELRRALDSMQQLIAFRLAWLERFGGLRGRTSWRARVARLHADLAAVRAARANPLAPLGWCEIDGRELYLFLRRDRSVQVCCTGDPQHCSRWPS